MLCDRIAPRLPHAPCDRIIEPAGDGVRSLGIGLRQKIAHPVIAKIGIEKNLERIAAQRAHRRGKGEERIHRLRKFGRSAPAVAHLTFDPARIGGTGANDARYFLGQMPYARFLLSIARVEMIERRLMSHCGCGRGQSSGKIGHTVTVEQITLAVVLNMHGCIGPGDAVAERVGGRASLRCQSVGKYSVWCTSEPS